MCGTHCCRCADKLCEVPNQEKVKEFHKAHDGGKADYPLAQRLILEETKELIDALPVELNEFSDRAALIKEMADVMYVLYGFADRFGIDLDEAFNRVHESNMSKVALDGKIYFRRDGKVLKPAHYRAPELGDL